MNRYDELKRGEIGAWLSIAAYISLSLVKILTGLYTGSEALLADGYNNTTDVVASIAVLIGLKIARKPPDPDHPYGHFRAETISSLLASFIMVSVGIQVLVSSGRAVLNPADKAPDLIAAWVALSAAAVMYSVYIFNRRLAKKTNSRAVMAAAQDNRSDALVSIGAAVGIFGSKLGLFWLDPLAAFAVGIMIMKTAWDIFRDASHALTDGFEETKLAELMETVKDAPGVRSISDIKARIHGSMILVDVTVQVDPLLNVIESHRITEEIEERMRKEHDIHHTLVHIEPTATKPNKNKKEKM